MSEEYGNLPADAPWWARWMIANWRQAFRWWSVNWSIVCGALAELYAQYGDQISAHVPPAWVPHIVAGGFWITVALRFVNQTKQVPAVQPPPPIPEKRGTPGDERHD